MNLSPFVHPALFWGGIGLIAIPIIIHLITRRRFRRLEWAAMEFLLEALRRNRRRIRLEQLLLLLLRVLLVALIVLAASRPHLSQEKYGWLSGPFQSEEKVFLVDDSLSMSHAEAGRSSSQRGAEAILQQLEKIARGGGRDPVTLIRASRFQAPLLNAAAVNLERLETLKPMLSSASLFSTATRLDLAPALEQLAGTAHPERGRMVSIVTDLCAADWTDGQGRPSPALRQALLRLAGSPENPTRIAILDVGPRSRGNLAVTAFALETANPIAGIPADLRIEVTNFGKETARGIGVRLRAGDAAIPGPRLAEIQPGESMQLRIPYTFTRKGPNALAAELDGQADGLPSDDRRSLVVEVQEAVEVLVVDGEPSGVPGEGETDFLAQALRPEGEVSSGYAPAVAVEANLPQESLERFAVVILANLAAVPEGFARLLRDYVLNGGGLIIFAGDQVDGARYEKTLGAASGAALLPASLGEIAGNPERPAHFEPQMDHPAFRLLAGGGEDLLRLVDVGRFLKLALYPGSRVIARLTDPESSPLLVERQAGKGKVALSAIPADLEWTNWPRSPSFLPVILELVGSMARPLGGSWNRAAGAPVEMPIDLSRYQREGRLQAPDYPASPEKKLLAAAAGKEKESGKEFRFTIEETRQSGVYTFFLKNLAGEEEVRKVAINSDPQESDLAAIDPERLVKLYPEVPLTVIRDPGAFTDSGGGRFEIADALLWLFIAVLFTEGTLAWWFAHHRQAHHRQAEGKAAPSMAAGGGP